MAFVVEIEWPLGGGPPVAPVFTASLKVRDDSDTGGGGSTADYKVICKLFKGNTTKDTQETALFDPSNEPELTVALNTNETGNHRLLARLVRTNTTIPTEIDTDEEINIDIQGGGASRRESQIFIIEE